MLPAQDPTPIGGIWQWKHPAQPTAPRQPAPHPASFSSPDMQWWHNGNQYK